MNLSPIWGPGRWWRVTYRADGGQGKTVLWCETSDEKEARQEAAKLTGREADVTLERLWERHESEWRTAK